jgi:hypothetical protein
MPIPLVLANTPPVLYNSELFLRQETDFEVFAFYDDGLQPYPPDVSGIHSWRPYARWENP